MTDDLKPSYEPIEALSGQTLHFLPEEQREALKAWMEAKFGDLDTIIEVAPYGRGWVVTRAIYQEEGDYVLLPPEWPKDTVWSPG